MVSLWGGAQSPGAALEPSSYAERSLENGQVTHEESGKQVATTTA